MTGAPKTVLVTGAAGFIGSAVVRRLIAATDARVISVDRLGYASSLAGLPASEPGDPVTGGGRHRFCRIDIRDRAAMQALLEECRPDAIIHLAAETHVDRSIDDPTPFIEANLMGTFALLETARAYWNALPAARQMAFRFVHVSTDEVFGSLTATDPAFGTTTPYRPTSPYSASKAGSDHLARAWFHTYGLPVVVTNCSNNYGPYQFPEKLIPLMIIKGLAGDPLPVYGTGLNVRDWLFVEDHARGLIAAMELGIPGTTYLFGGSAEVTNRAVVERICDELDRLLPAEAPRRTLITSVPDRPGHDFRYAVDWSRSRSRQDLGWAPEVDFDKGLAQTVLWYLQHRAWWADTQARYGGERLGLGQGQG